MTTSRERFLQTLEFQPANPPWVRWGLYLWDDTILRWRGEGWDGRPLEDIFGLDLLERVDPYYGPVPDFADEIIAEDEETVVHVNHEGIVMREFKAHRDASMPQFVKFPVETEAEWRQFAAERLAPNPAQRLNREWQRLVAPFRNPKRAAAGQTALAAGASAGVPGLAPPGGPLYDDAGAPVLGGAVAQRSGTALADEHARQCWADRWGGFFGSIRNMIGVQRLCTAFYDEPAWVERMMAERADAIIAITGEVLRYTDFDVFWFWEDMAYKAGPLVGPAMYRKFAFKHYRRVCDWLHSQGIRHIGLDSDGDTRLLIPIWLDAGIDHLWPFEVQAGMDVLAIRRQYGHDLAILGGVDKRALVLGGEAMRREVDRVTPLVEDGGYIPELDHGVPPDVSWPAFCDYMEYLKFRLGRG